MHVFASDKRNVKKMYDLIGDIHGHADELEQLLRELGYCRESGVYRHPERKVIFLGDFIDRGPKISEVLAIARGMVESGNALAVMGNHELNAMAYHTRDPNAPGEFLRRHNEKNERQHHQTVRQLSPGDLRSHLAWFRTLPMWLDLPELRVVHACWDAESMQAIMQAGGAATEIMDEFLFAACKPRESLFFATEIVLKGKEIPLPAGIYYRDKDGHERVHVRTRWYLPAEGKTYRTYSFQSDEVDCDEAIPRDIVGAAIPYPADAKPVFIGHYWLRAFEPSLLVDNVVCLDYSVANGGFLCAYRWNGDSRLDRENLVWVPA